MESNNTAYKHRVNHKVKIWSDSKGKPCSTLAQLAMPIKAVTSAPGSTQPGRVPVEPLPPTGDAGVGQHEPIENLEDQVESCNQHIRLLALPVVAFVIRHISPASNAQGSWHGWQHSHWSVILGYACSVAACHRLHHRIHSISVGDYDEHWWRTLFMTQQAQGKN